MTSVTGSGEGLEFCERRDVGKNGAAVRIFSPAIESLIEAAQCRRSLNENQTSTLNGLLEEYRENRPLSIQGLLTLYAVSENSWAKEQLFYALLGGAAVDLFIWLSTNHSDCPVLEWLNSDFRIPKICGDGQETLPTPGELKDILSTVLPLNALRRAYSKVKKLLALSDTEEEKERVRIFLHLLNLIGFGEHGKPVGP